MRRPFFGKNAYLHVLRHLIARSCDHCLCQRRSSKTPYNKNITTFEKLLIERGYPQNFINNTLSDVKFEEGTQTLSNETKKGSNLALCNTITSNSSKSYRNPNKEVVPNS